MGRESLRAGKSLQRPDESKPRQVVAGDRGLDVGGCHERRPSVWSRFESERSTPGNQITHVGRDHIDLSCVGSVRFESQPARDAG